MTANPRTQASILHADMDAFYASVEQRDDPALAGKPVIVSGGGVVLAASYQAKAAGVQTATGLGQARAQCPGAIVVPPRFAAYAAASRAVFAIFHDITPLVEPLSIDEAFLDVAGLRRLSGTPADIAATLRARVAAEVGLAVTVGVARTKFLAKVASGAAKPDGLLVVPPEGEVAFLHPLPVRKLWGVGKVTTAKLNSIGLHTVADVAACDEATLVALLGAHTGRHLLALAQFRDERSVDTGRAQQSVGAQHALGRGRHSPAELDMHLVGLVDAVGRRLRRKHVCGRTVTLRLRFGDFRRITRSATLSRQTDTTAELLTAVRSLLAGELSRIRDQGITLIGLAVSGLGPGAQDELPFADDGPDTRDLDAVMDAIRGRFGDQAISTAVLLGRQADWIGPVSDGPVGVDR